MRNRTSRLRQLVIALTLVFSLGLVTACAQSAQQIAPTHQVQENKKTKESNFDGWWGADEAVWEPSKDHVKNNPSWSSWAAGQATGLLYTGLGKVAKWAAGQAISAAVNKFAPAVIGWLGLDAGMFGFGPGDTTQQEILETLQKISDQLQQTNELLTGVNQNLTALNDSVKDLTCQTTKASVAPLQNKIADKWADYTAQQQTLLKQAKAKGEKAKKLKASNLKVDGLKTQLDKWSDSVVKEMPEILNTYADFLEDPSDGTGHLRACLGKNLDKWHKVASEHAKSDKWVYDQMNSVVAYFYTYQAQGLQMLAQATQYQAARALGDAKYFDQNGLAPLGVTTPEQVTDPATDVKTMCQVAWDVTQSDLNADDVAAADRVKTIADRWDVIQGAQSICTKAYGESNGTLHTVREKMKAQLLLVGGAWSSIELPNPTPKANDGKERIPAFVQPAGSDVLFPSSLEAYLQQYGESYKATGQPVPKEMAACFDEHGWVKQSQVTKQECLQWPIHAQQVKDAALTTPLPFMGGQLYGQLNFDTPAAWGESWTEGVFKGQEAKDVRRQMQAVGFADPGKKVVSIDVPNNGDANLWTCRPKPGAFGSTWLGDCTTGTKQELLTFFDTGLSKPISNLQNLKDSLGLWWPGELHNHGGTQLPLGEKKAPVSQPPNPADFAKPVPQNIQDNYSWKEWYQDLWASQNNGDDGKSKLNVFVYGAPWFLQSVIDNKRLDKSNLFVQASAEQFPPAVLHWPVIRFQYDQSKLGCDPKNQFTGFNGLCGPWLESYVEARLPTFDYEPQ